METGNTPNTKFKVGDLVYVISRNGQRCQEFVFCILPIGGKVTILSVLDTNPFSGSNSQCYKVTSNHIFSNETYIIKEESLMTIEEYENSDICYDCDIPIGTLEMPSYQNEYDENNRCPNCNREYENTMNEDDDIYSSDVVYRKYLSKPIISKAKKNIVDNSIIQSKRGFGVEIELYSKSYNTINEIGNSISDSIGISEDGSLDDKGFELQFPLINGKKAEDLVNDTCQVLKDFKCFVNGTCGYHLHLQCLPQEQGFNFTQRLMFLSMIFEDIISSFVPKSRRNNRYCQQLKNYIQIDRIIACTTKYDLEYVWYKPMFGDISERKREKYDNSRYYGFNFHSYLGKNKHLEIRHHSATINSEKILHWANLHTLFMDFVSKNVKEKTMEECVKLFIPLYDLSYSDKRKLAMKTKLLFDEIGLSEKSRNYFLNRQTLFQDNNEDTETLSSN